MVREAIFKNSYIFEILCAIAKEPKRYSDLFNVCPNETTRSRRLKELETEGLITTNIINLNKKNAIFYKLTNKGQKLLNLYFELRKI